MKIIKELFAFVRIVWAYLKESRMKNKLYGHRIKMLKIYKEYENSELQMSETKYWLGELHAKIISWRSEL